MAKTEAQVALDALYSVMDELNEERPEDEKLARDPATPLYGAEGNLDSIDLVRLVVMLEQKINDITDRAISITDDRALSQHESHFQTVRTLADYVMQLMREEADG